MSDIKQKQLFSVSIPKEIISILHNGSVRRRVLIGSTYNKDRTIIIWCYQKHIKNKMKVRRKSSFGNLH